MIILLPHTLIYVCWFFGLRSHIPRGCWTSSAVALINLPRCYLHAVTYLVTFLHVTVDLLHFIWLFVVICVVRLLVIHTRYLHLYLALFFLYLDSSLVYLFHIPHTYGLHTWLVLGRYITFGFFIYTCPYTFTSRFSLGLPFLHTGSFTHLCVTGSGHCGYYAGFTRSGHMDTHTTHIYTHYPHHIGSSTHGCSWFIALHRHIWILHCVLQAPHHHWFRLRFLGLAFGLVTFPRVYGSFHHTRGIGFTRLPLLVLAVLRQIRYFHAHIDTRFVHRIILYPYIS